MSKAVTKIINGKICLSTASMCEVFGVTQQALSQWDDKGCPKAGRGWWSIADVLRWKGFVGVDGSRNEKDQESVSWMRKKLEAEATLKEEKAEEAAMKNAINRGEYIRKEDITAELQRFFTVLKRSMTGYSRTVATEVSGFVDVLTARRIEKMVMELTMDALEQISIDGVYEPTKKKRA